MKCNTKHVNYLVVVKDVALLYGICLLTIVLYVGILIPDKAEPDKYAKTCLSTSDGSIKCKRTEIWFNTYVRKVLEYKYRDIVKEKEQERKLFFETHYKNTKTPSTYEGLKFSNKPSAKLIGKLCPNSSCNTVMEQTKKFSKGMTPIDTWYTDIELERRGGFLRHGVRAYNGRLVVPVNGTYYVYSFVAFYEPCFYPSGIPNVKNKTSPIKHAMYRYSVSDNTNTEVVSSAQPHKIVKDNTENVYNSHISTVLDLYAGDELSLQVSNITLLEYTGDNYFELILI